MDFKEVIYRDNLFKLQRGEDENGNVLLKLFLSVFDLYARVNPNNEYQLADNEIYYDHPTFGEEFLQVLIKYGICN